MCDIGNEPSRRHRARPDDKGNRRALRGSAVDERAQLKAAAVVERDLESVPRDVRAATASDPAEEYRNQRQAAEPARARNADEVTF